MPSPKPAKLSLTEIIQQNKWLSIAFLLWLSLVSISLAIHEQGHWILYLNERSTPFWDIFFKYGTQFAEEWAMIAVLIVLLFLSYRASITYPLMMLGTLITTGLSKKFFAHPRPLSYFTELGSVEQLSFVAGVHINGGPTSFPSGHTMAGFAIFIFLAFNSKNKKLVALLLFALAAMVGISRIYLVQHFLKDVYLGSVVGLAIALLAYYLQQYWGGRAWMDGRLGFKKSSNTA